LETGSFLGNSKNGQVCSTSGHFMGNCVCRVPNWELSKHS
jgi:hypothetical protein